MYVEDIKRVLEIYEKHKNYFNLLGYDLYRSAKFIQKTIIQEEAV